MRCRWWHRLRGVHRCWCRLSGVSRRCRWWHGLRGVCSCWWWLRNVSRKEGKQVICLESLFNLDVRLDVRLTLGSEPNMALYGVCLIPE